MEHPMTLFVADLVATIMFAAAFFFSIWNYRLTRRASNYWLIFALAALFGATWAGLVTLEWLHIFPAKIDPMEEVFAASAATSFGIAALITLESQIEPAY